MYSGATFTSREMRFHRREGIFHGGNGGLLRIASSQKGERKVREEGSLYRRHHRGKGLRGRSGRRGGATEGKTRIGVLQSI